MGLTYPNKQMCAYVLYSRETMKNIFLLGSLNFIFWYLNLSFAFYILWHMVVNYNYRDRLLVTTNKANYTNRSFANPDWFCERFYWVIKSGFK